MEDKEINVAGALGGIAGSMIMYSLGMAGMKHVGGVIGQALMKGSIQAARKIIPSAAKTNYQRMFNTAITGLKKMPTNQTVVAPKQFFKAVGINANPMSSPLGTSVKNFVEDQAYSLPVSYLAEYHRAKTEGESVSFGKVAMDSVVNDVLFRGAGKMYRVAQPKIMGKMGRKADSLFNKSELGRRLTDVHKRVSYYDDTYMKNMALSHKRNTLQNDKITTGPLARITSSFQAMKRVNETPEDTINELYEYKFKTQVNSHFPDKSLSPQVLDDKGVYVGFKDLKTSLSTLAKSTVNSIKFGNVSIAKSMGLNHMIHDAESDIRYSQIKGQLVLSQESSIKFSSSVDVNERIATTLAHHVGESDIPKFVKSPFGRKMLGANVGNKDVMHGAINLPSDITATSSSKGLHYYDQVTKQSIQGGSKMMSTGLESDAQTWYIFDNNRAGSNLHHTYMSYITGKPTKEDPGQTLGAYFPKVIGGEDTAMDQMRAIHNENPLTFSDDMALASRVTNPLIDSFHNESRSGAREAYSNVANTIRSHADDVGRTIPYIEPEHLNTEGSAAIKQMENLRRLYKFTDESVPNNVETLFNKIKEHPGEAMRVKSRTTLNIKTGKMETESYNTLNELNDQIALSYYDDIAKNNSRWTDVTIDKTDRTMIDLYENSKSNKTQFIEDFSVTAQDPETYDVIRSKMRQQGNSYNNDFSFEEVHPFQYAELLAPRGSMVDGESQYFNLFNNQQPENVHTIGELVLYNATSVVEPLSRTLGVKTKPTLGHDLYTFYEDLVNKSMWNIAGAYGSYVGINALAENGAFDGTGLESGVLPFAGSVYNDVRMTSQFVTDVTGVSSMARGLEGLVPGLVDSPFGAALGTLLPILGGVIAGANAITPYGLAGGLGIGLAGSAVLGGLGTGVYGHHNITDSASELYGKFTGNDKIGVRKGRFWGPSSGSFLGDNVQYNRGYWSSNNSDPRMSSDYYGTATQQLADSIGLSDPTNRNYYTRPLLGSVDGLSGGSGGSGSSAGISGDYGISNDPTNQTLNDMHEEFYGMSEVYGMRGFLMKDAVVGNLRGDSVIDFEPTLQTSDDLYSLDKMFWDSNYGGMMGNTEYIRRILPKYKQNGNVVNPAPNNMPDWLPSSGYFIDFQIGDPFSKIQEGQMRLPGLSYLRSNNVDLNNIPYDLDYMGFITNRETIDNILGVADGESIETKTNRKMIKDELMSNYKDGITGYEVYTRDNPVYYAGGGIIAQADLQVNSNAMKFEVVSNKVFNATKSNQDTTYQRKADLLATISEKEATYIIVNEDTKAQLTIVGKWDKSLLMAEMDKLNKLKPEIYKQLKNNKLANSNNLYSLADRYAVLADVAPYSMETRHYEKIMKDMASAGELRNDEIIKVSNAKRLKDTVLNKSNLNMTGVQSPLSGILPDKVLAPGNIDPLESYIAGYSHGSKMKRWEEPLSYARSDIATTLSGAANPIRRGINSGILYGVMYGSGAGAVAGAATATMAGVANAMGGINVNRDYLESRQALLQESALGYARNQASDTPYIGRNLYGQMTNGGSINDLLKSVDTVDRQYIQAFANETDPDRRKLISQSIHPIYASILDQKWGTNNSDPSNSLNRATEYYNQLDEEDILNKSIDIKDVTVRYLDKKGIDPRTVGRGFNEQRYGMYLNKNNNSNKIETGFLQSIKSISGVNNVKIIGNTSDKVIEVIFVER